MERYTPQAKEALSLAVGVAESLNHGYVGTEHLLIGLLQEGTGVAAKVLEENGVEEDKVVELVSQLIAPNPTLQTADTAAYTPRARRVIENSYREAVRFNLYMCIIDCLSTIVFILPLHLDYTKVIILILWWRNFQQIGRAHV